MIFFNRRVITVDIDEHDGTLKFIGDAHLTKDGGEAQGPPEPQRLARRTLGTWLPYRTSL
jgi:hypothetical protein